MACSRIAFAVLLCAGLISWTASARAQTGAPSLGPVAQLPMPPAPSPVAAQPPQPGSSAPAAADPVGSVSELEGSASVSHRAAASALHLRDAVFKGDVLQTGADGTLGITFDDETTFTLKPNSQITVDNFIYQEGGANNAAAFNVLRGTVAFVAAEVAHTGNMKIDTPTSSLGIRGTTGLIEIPTGGAAGGEVSVKLYPDADGRVGRIELFGRDGSQLGVLTRGATGFAIRPGAPGGRFTAVPLQISAAEAARDRAFVSQAFAARAFGRQINIQRRSLQQRQRNLRQPGQPFERRPELERRPGPRMPGGRPGAPAFQQRAGAPAPRGAPHGPAVQRRPAPRQGSQNH